MGLFFDSTSEAHITIAVRKGATEEDQKNMERALVDEVAPLFPIFVRISPEISWKGKDHDVETHDVTFVNPDEGARFRAIYGSFYREDDDASVRFIDHAPHVSTDKPEKRQLIEHILQNEHGIATIRRAELRRLGEKVALFKV